MFLTKQYIETTLANKAIFLNEKLMKEYLQTQINLHKKDISYLEERINNLSNKKIKFT